MLFTSLRRCRGVASPSLTKPATPSTCAIGRFEVDAGAPSNSAPPSSSVRGTNPPRRTSHDRRSRSRSLHSSSMPTAVRISSDLAPPDSRSLRHGAALRIADHHLHVSPLLPSVASMAENGMDAYCVGQAATCPRHSSDLLSESYAVSAETAPESHLWVSKSRAGSSAVTFGSAVTLNGRCLAACARTFVRVDVGAGVSERRGRRRKKRVDARADTGDEEEHSGLYRPHDDADGSGRFGVAVPEISRINVAALGTTTTTTMTSEGEGDKLASSHPPYGAEVLRVDVGPHHLNHFGHVDHAFLAEAGGGASGPPRPYSSPPDDSEGAGEREDPSRRPPTATTLRVEYAAPGRLGQVLSCRMSDCGRVASIWGRDEDERCDGGGGKCTKGNDALDRIWKIIALAEYS
eukprot:CAMPEP_0113545552 /NCGR_PEP_ID=MMETSP0015_2-20120614/11324_1 /TAXON_ID=2838 /ORGANISM="Odontella" /LENGTH=404 /DNA_ID=CAMNT_0000445929 /DNA_START=149 /DNA_END=1364 /DNA_ORIENTATION=- /assembly_acc=CAM_ASM_000160